VPDPTLYLFDGWNLMHAGAFADPRELRDALASFVALQGARGILVFDGVGDDEERGPLRVRFAVNADAVLERLAAEHRGRERVCLVSSDAAVRGTAGQEVMKRSSRTFLGDLEATTHRESRPSSLADRLDEETLARLERLRRGLH
jgi:predicted RNA-binding protein with PIN domain